MRILVGKSWKKNFIYAYCWKSLKDIDHKQNFIEKLAFQEVTNDQI